MARQTAGAGSEVLSETELTAPVQLCDSRGRLLADAVGWSRKPLHTCDINGHWPRKKAWNYWCVTSDRYLFSVTVASVDYLGLAFAYFLDFETRRFIEKTVPVPLAAGVRLPPEVRGDITFGPKSMPVAFREEGDRTRLHVECPRFGGGSLVADIVVERPPDHETLNVVIPWSASRFHFTSKQNCLPAAGTVRLGDDTFEFPAGGAFACLDYGRGVWRYSTRWNWGSLSGVQNGRTVGLNLGGAWTDGTGMTENAIVVDGRISKLGEDVSFSWDRADLMKPWQVKTEGSSRVDLRFEPFFERVARTNLLLLRSEVHQMIGRYYGTVMPDGGGPLRIDGMIGWVENHEARW